MTYILLDQKKNLIATKRDEIYRGEKMSSKVVFILPLSVSGIDVSTASVKLNYTRSDNWSNMVTLERSTEMYNDSYYRYVTPVDSHMTAKSGKLTLWLEIMAADETVAKTSQCTLKILDSTDIDGHTPEDEEDRESLMAAIMELQEAIRTKADGIAYDPDTRQFSLVSGETAIGTAVTVPDDQTLDNVKTAAESVWENF